MKEKHKKYVKAGQNLVERATQMKSNRIRLSKSTITNLWSLANLLLQSKGKIVGGGESFIFC
jgi:hypothetical protein